jgi:anaerobic selenocysteine-containing dehydrogenase
VKFDGHPANPRNEGTLCPKGQAQIGAIYDPNRVKTPLMRTNGKGETGEWREASWDEALDVVADKVNEARARDSKSVLWQKGRSKAKEFYDEAFVDSIDCSKLGHGAYCSDAGYRAQEYTIGLHGVHHPDMEQTNYLLAWGWNITNAGGNKFCWLTWPRQMVKARERGMKIVHLDPRLRSAGPFADEWLPIRPATDLAMALALCNVLIEEDFLDREYLTTYTNATYLVGDDGKFVRTDDQELVWDGATDAAVPVGEAQDPQLEGTFEVLGAEVKPAFELFKEHVADATPEWAAEICGLDADQIRQVGVDFGENARIGDTRMVDGVEVPYRPVAIMAYHMAQQELGFQASRAMTMVTMLVGAVGAAGGQFTDFKWKIHDGYEDLDNIEIVDPPESFTLKGSKFYPINSGLPGLVAQVMNDPDRFGVEKVPEVAILHMVNPLGSFPDQKEMMAGYEKFSFVAVISPWLSETADYYADVILPAATIEKYEGPISATDQYIDAKTMRLPPMDPLFDSKGEIDIYLDLTEKMGVLTGEGGYLDFLNEALELEAPFLLDLETKPTPREILDTWSRFEELEGGIEFFEKNGTWNKGRVDPADRYGYVTDPPFGGVVHRLYGESLLGYQEQMRELDADESYWQDYTAFPTWRPPTMEGSPDEFDLYLIGYKQVENKQSRSSFMPLLAELAPTQHLDICPAAARERGIDDGDDVLVESQNSVTGETRQLETVAVYSEGIRPDTVAMPHHFGLWTHPNSADTGPSPNEIMFTGEGYTTNTADQSFHVKVRVTPA